MKRQVSYASTRQVSLSSMLSTRQVSFTRHPSRLSPATPGERQRQNSADDDPNIPPLDKIPTNEFIEKFLEDDEPDGVPDRKLASSSSRMPSASTTKPHSARSSRFRAGAKTADDDADDLETVLDTSEKRPPFDDTGQRAYELACRRFKALPCSRFSKKLASSDKVNLGYYNTGSTGAMAMAVPMLVNTKLTSLNLRGNDLNGRGVRYIGEVMGENTSITELNLADNNLRTRGAKAIAQMLNQNLNIKRLDISGNNFSDADAQILAKPIEEHVGLRYLNLSNNDFGEQAGIVFGSMISENGVLQELDLSWNQIRMKGALEVARGIKDNIGLKSVSLAWNGFGDSGAQEMAAALKTCTLTELDLSSNRIGEKGFVAMAKALANNDELKTLRLCKNPIPLEAAIVVFQFFKSTQFLALELLDLGDIHLGSKADEYIKQVSDVHESFTCRHGYTDSYGKRRLRQYDVVEEALNAMRDYCQEHNINIVELFSRFDLDGSMSVSHDEFKLGLREAKIPLTDLQIDELIKTLDQDGDGEIDFSEMVLGAEMYKPGEQEAEEQQQQQQQQQQSEDQQDNTPQSKAIP